MHMTAASDRSARSPQPSGVEQSVRDRFPGEVGQIFGAADLDAMLAEDKDALVVLMSTLTWCRPCKGLAKPFQVHLFWQACMRALSHVGLRSMGAMCMPN